MNCAFDKEKLTGYYDGELGTAEKAEVERHIASCSECLRDLGELKSAALLVRDLPRLRAPKSIAEGVSREIQAAGKVHVFSRMRRTVLWASAAAAGLFVVMNVMYFSSKERNAPMTEGAPAMVRAAAKADPMASTPPPAPAEAKDGRSLDLAKSAEDADRADVRRNAAPPMARQEQQPAPQKNEELRKANDEEPSRKKVVAADKEGGGAKPGAAPVTAPPPPPAPAAMPEKPLTAAPAAPAAKAAPAPAPAPEPKPESKQTTDALAEKAAAKRELDAVPKTEPADAKAKLGAAGPPPADLPPVLCNVVTTQLAKSRTRVEESLKAIGIALPTPPPAQPRAPRNREAENTLVLELTESQFIRLKEEIEKPGDARLVVTSPVDPVLPAFGRGGLYGPKKDVASSGAKAPAAKEAEAPAGGAAKSLADQGAPEPRRKVTLHLVESKTLPAADAEPAKKQ